MVDGEVKNLILDDDRVMRLAFKILALLERKGKQHPSRGDLASEYWALRVAVLYYEGKCGVVFDNEAYIVAHFKELLARL